MSMFKRVPDPFNEIRSEVQKLADKYIEEQNARLGPLWPNEKRDREKKREKDVEDTYRSLLERPKPAPKRRAKKASKAVPVLAWIPFDEHDMVKTKTKRRAAKAQLTEMR